MSRENEPVRLWSINKYVDLRTSDHRTLIGADLSVEFNRCQRLLRILNRTSLIENINLSRHRPSLSFRDTSVVFLLTVPNVYLKFRIRFENLADRICFCKALQEFLSVEEAPPPGSQPHPRGNSLTQTFDTSGSASQPCVSNFSGSFRSTCATPIPMFSACISPPHNLQNLSQGTPNKNILLRPSIVCRGGSTSRRQVQDAQTQTEPPIFSASLEELQIELTRLLRDASFQQFVESMIAVMPTIDEAYHLRRV